MLRDPEIDAAPLYEILSSLLPGSITPATGQDIETVLQLIASTGGFTGPLILAPGSSTMQFGIAGEFLGRRFGATVTADLAYAILVMADNEDDELAADALFDALLAEVRGDEITAPPQTTEGMFMAQVITLPTQPADDVDIDSDLESVRTFILQGAPDPLVKPKRGPGVVVVGPWGSRKLRSTPADSPPPAAA